MYAAALLVHLLLFAYWLGGDLGTYYSSRFVQNRGLSPAQRTTALKIMSGCDLAPRICLVLILPSGVTLMASQPHGATFLHAWQVGAVWVLSLIWLALAIRSSLSERALMLRRLDLVVRIGLVVGLLSIGAYTVLVTDPFGVTTNPKWLGGKVMLYAIAIACGVGIRCRLRPFGPAFTALVTTGSTPEAESQMSGAIRGSKAYVYTIWLCVSGAALLGAVRPGAHLG